MKLRNFQTNFTAGELSTEASSRSDLNLYNNGAKTILNYRQLVQGGVERRPATKYLLALDPSKKYQFERFIKSRNESYLLIFSANQLQVLDLSTNTIVYNNTSTSWTSSMIGDLYVAQSSNVAIITHEDLPIQELRLSGSTWTISNFAFEKSSTNKIYAPFYKYASLSSTLTPSGTTGTITVTCSESHFTSNYVGYYLRYKGKQLLVTGYTSPTVLTCQVIETLPSTTADTDWDEEMYSIEYGYPVACIFNNQRLHFIGAKNLPRRTNSSNVSAFWKFDVGTGQDDESIQGEASENSIGQLIGCAGLKQLQLFGDSGELFIPVTESKPLTPSNLSYKLQSRYGSKVRHPADFDKSTLYITASGLVREFLYDALEGGFSSTSLIYLSEHLFTDPIRIVSQLEGFGYSEQYAFVLNTDGSIVVLISERNEKVNGWSKWTTDGTFKEIQAIYDRVFVAVERTINSSTVLWLEEFKLDKTLDGHIDYTSGSATSTWSGITEYAGHEVYVVSGNYYIGKYTIDASGNLDISPYSVDKITVGLNYTTKLETLPPELQLPDGPSVGEMKRIVKIVVDFNNTLNAIVNKNKLIIRTTSEDLSLEPTPVSKKKEFYSRGWDKSGTIVITQDEPLPIGIRSIATTIEL